MGKSLKLHSAPEFGQHAGRALRSDVGTVCEPLTADSNLAADTLTTIHRGRPLIVTAQVFCHLLQVLSRARGTAGTVLSVHHHNVAVGQSAPGVHVHDALIVPSFNATRKDVRQKTAVKLQ